MNFDSKPIGNSKNILKEDEFLKVQVRQLKASE